MSTRVKLVVAACLEHLWGQERFPHLSQLGHRSSVGADCSGLSLANEMYRASPLCSPVRGTEGGCQTGQTCFVSLGLLKTWAVLAVLSRYCWCAVRVILGVKLERAWRASVWWETLSYITYDLRVKSELGWTSGKGQV